MDPISDRLAEFQCNSAFVAFTLIVCGAVGLYLVEILREVLLPLIWAVFFALPMQQFVEFLNRLLILVSSRLLSLCVVRGSALEPVRFWHTPGRNRISIERTSANVALLERVGRPCGPGAAGCCRRRLRITRLGSGGAGPRLGVNCLRVGWSYFVEARGAEPPEEAAGGPEREEGAGAPMLELALFLDAGGGGGQYPAVVAEDGAPMLEPGGGEREEGALEADRTSQVTWIFAVLLALLVVLTCVAGFAGLLVTGVASLERSVASYRNGTQEFLDRFVEEVSRRLPAEALALDSVEDDFMQTCADLVQEYAYASLSTLSSVIFEIMMFMIYLLFFLVEPTPVSTSVVSLFKSYLLVKTMVCFLFAVLVSVLMWSVSCPLWPLFFIVTFFANYIPEVGPVLVSILAMPAVLFDGTVADLNTRVENVFWVAFFFGFFKVLTGNVIEVRLYATGGGEFMRMHPVVLLVFMMIFGGMLGVTGMFLAVPFVAAVKYFIVTSDVPPVVLNPILIFIEGHKAAPHRNFVERHEENRALAGSRGQLHFRHPHSSIELVDRQMSSSSSV